MTRQSELRQVLLAGCQPEVAIGADGRIIATGASARTAVGTDAEIHELQGRAWPGLTDSHVHLQWLAQLKLTLDLSTTEDLGQAVAEVRRYVSGLESNAFVVGRGWVEGQHNGGRRPDRALLDAAVGGRPAVLRRRDGHSAWLSSSGLELAGIGPETPDPPGGTIERDESGRPTGIVRETAVELAESVFPQPEVGDLERALSAVLEELAAFGLTSVHSMDPVLTFSLLERIRRKGPLPVRVTYNFPVVELAHLERLGVRSGWGDEYLRVWGVKAFLDGSLGSGTAEMLDGTGLVVMEQDELIDVIRRAAHAELNVCLHAIGDKAVRRALDALEPAKNAWRYWRPRIEHAQCVDPTDMPRFARVGAVVSMQPAHAIADRKLAQIHWGARTAYAYAWQALRTAGAVLAFGSDAPIDRPDPLAGLHAATEWRRSVRDHPELALTERQALKAYTQGPSYAVGLERELGALRRGMRGDVTVVDSEGVAATVVGGRFSWQRGRRKTRRASPRFGRDARL